MELLGLTGNNANAGRFLFRDDDGCFENKTHCEQFESERDIWIIRERSCIENKN